MALKLAIVGRPNVGKSTLFNRLVGKKVGMVDDRPGVTRDRKEAAGTLGDLKLILIDTAGFENATGDVLEARMQRQTDKAIEQADICLFMIDARDGVTPMDERFAELLRRSGKPVILAANKAEGKQGDQGIMEAYALGFGEPLAMSGEHGEGMAELYAELLKKGGAKADAPLPVEAQDGYEAFDPDDETPEDKTRPIKLAIVGRPNAGKSTLINTLLDEDRMLTGPEAGITRDSVSIDWQWEDRTVRLTDTAGLRRKARVHEHLERLSTMETIRSLKYADVVAIIMDARDAFEKQDLQIADLIAREGRAIVFVCSKWDLVEDPSTRRKELEGMLTRLLPQVKGARLVTLSGLTGRHTDKLMPTVVKAYDDWGAKVKTRDLNDWLRAAIEKYPPPSVAAGRIKPKYMAQIKTRPPTFVLMASRGRMMPESYQRYLVNGVRDAFDLWGTPIRLNVREGKNPFADKG
jgi:GTPase